MKILIDLETANHLAKAGIPLEIYADVEPAGGINGESKRNGSDETGKSKQESSQSELGLEIRPHRRRWINDKQMFELNPNPKIKPQWGATKEAFDEIARKIRSKHNKRISYAEIKVAFRRQKIHGASTLSNYYDVLIPVNHNG